MGVVEEYPGYWGGTTIAMAIVTSVIMNDHQKFNNNGNSKSGIRCDKGVNINLNRAISQVID
jgi:hypothetical protein